MFYRRDRPASSVVTVALLILWLLLAVYFLTHPDLISIIALVVTAIFVAFALFVTVAVQRAERERLDVLADEPARNMVNGHHHSPPTIDSADADANTMREVPEEEGDNP